MHKNRFTEFQFIAMLKSVEAGRSVEEVCLDAGITEASYYEWKARYDGMNYLDIIHLKELEEENRLLKQKFAALTIENKALKEILEKKS
jgi:putative transposase